MKKIEDTYIKGLTEKFATISTFINTVDNYYGQKEANVLIDNELNVASQLIYIHLKKELPLETIRNSFGATFEKSMKSNQHEKINFMEVIENGCRDINEYMEVSSKLENTVYKKQVEKEVDKIMSIFAKSGFGEDFIDALCDVKLNPIEISDIGDADYLIRRNSNILTTGVASNLRLLIEPYFNTTVYSEERTKETVSSITNSISKFLLKAGDENMQSIMKDALSSFVAKNSKNFYIEKNQNSLNNAAKMK